jgi:hypothetical protein
VGIHYRFDSDDGLALGRAVGADVATNELAVPEPGAVAVWCVGVAGAVMGRRRRRS